MTSAKLFTREGRSYALIQEGAHIGEIVPATYKGQCTETKAIGPDQIDCTYEIFEATINGQVTRMRRLARTFPKGESPDDTRVVDEAYRRWISAEDARRAAERNAEIEILHESLISDRPREFLRTRPSSEFNKLWGNVDTSAYLIMAYLEFVGLQSPTTHYLRMWDAEVAERIRSRLRELVLAIREERRLAWQAKA